MVIAMGPSTSPSAVTIVCSYLPAWTVGRADLILEGEALLVAQRAPHRPENLRAAGHTRLPARHASASAAHGSGVPGRVAPAEDTLGRRAGRLPAAIFSEVWGEGRRRTSGLSARTLSRCTIENWWDAEEWSAQYGQRDTEAQLENRYGRRRVLVLTLKKPEIFLAVLGCAGLLVSTSSL